MMLARIDLASGSGQQLFSGVARQPSIRGKAGDVVVDGATYLVRMALGDQYGDEIDHSRDVLRRSRVVIGSANVDEGGVVHERLRVVSGDLRGRFAFESRRDEHLVFATIEGVICQVPDVGDVHHQLGVMPEVLEAATQQVREHERSQVADVHVAVDGWAARVDAHLPRLERPQLFLLSREGVVQTNGRHEIESMLAVMRAHRLDGRTATDADIEGRVLVHDLGPDLRKGTVLSPEHLERVRRSGEVHIIELEPGDLHEDVAAMRLAAALSAPNLEPQPPIQSQARLIASLRGLVRVRAEAVDAINALGYMSVFTLMDGQAVAKGEEVAGFKVTPVAVPGRLIEAAERIKPKARELFRGAVTSKLGWYGADLLAVREVARTTDAVAGAYREAAAMNAELILFAGASAIDPLDPAYAELTNAGGHLLQLGAPMHPGSMLWLARLGDAAVVGVASCAGFGRSSSLDLLLPFVFAYGRADAKDLLRLGHGGLIESAAGRRFPPYS